MKIDQISEDGIRRLVDEFYARVRADTELAPIFYRAIPGDWGRSPCIFALRAWSRGYSTVGWSSSATRAASCLMRAWLRVFAPRHFVSPRA